jgi:hypothetical protein
MLLCVMKCMQSVRRGHIKCWDYNRLHHELFIVLLDKNNRAAFLYPMHNRDLYGPLLW